MPAAASAVNGHGQYRSPVALVTAAASGRLLVIDGLDENHQWTQRQACLPPRLPSRAGPGREDALYPRSIAFKVPSQVGKQLAC